MRVLVTGGLGLVGRSVVAELLAQGHVVRLFDTPGAGPVHRILAAAGTARRRLRSLLAARTPEGIPRLEVVRGDLCNIAHVGEAAREVDAAIHLGAMIPPAADRYPRRAAYVNEGGTANLVRALERRSPGARLVFASSIAVYGDRRRDPLIRPGDPVNPGAHDAYAQAKVAAERIVAASSLRWVILRLSYVVSPEKLAMDPLMFSMPLDTRLEVCSVADTARAFVNAIDADDVEERILTIAGGEACRTTYRDYLDTMTTVFGLGPGFLPAAAFSTADFHCAYVDTADSQGLLDYQRQTLADYYLAVSRRVRLRRLLIRGFPLLRRVIRSRLARRSPFLPPGRAPGANAVLATLFRRLRRHHA